MEHIREIIEREYKNLTREQIIKRWAKVKNEKRILFNQK